MVDIPDSLQAVFSATIEKQDGKHVISVPTQEITHESITPGKTYRVAILEPTVASESSSESEKSAETTAQHSEPESSEKRTPPVEKGEIRGVVVESIGDQGDGIARVDQGYVVIVPGAEPGDEPTVEIKKVRQNVAFASVVE
jgi:predicted RNA-binding protein with TRAM domain